MHAVIPPTATHKFICGTKGTSAIEKTQYEQAYLLPGSTTALERGPWAEWRVLTNQRLRMRSAHPEKPCMERTSGQVRSKSQHKFKQENCSDKEVEVKYVLVTQPRGFLTRKCCRMLLLSKLLAKQDNDLNWRSILKENCYIQPTFLNPATCSCSVKNWEGAVKVTNYMIPNEVSWWEASLGTWREVPLKESCFNKLGKGVSLHTPIHTFT